MYFVVFRAAPQVRFRLGSPFLGQVEGLSLLPRLIVLLQRASRLPGASQGILVLSWTPCHSFNRSPRAALTKRCCLSMLRPRNFSDPISMPYIDPQPPEISCTMSSVGANSAESMSQTLDSPSLKKSGFTGATASVDSTGKEAAAGLEKVLCVEEIVRTCVWDCGDWIYEIGSGFTENQCCERDRVGIEASDRVWMAFCRNKCDERRDACGRAPARRQALQIIFSVAMRFVRDGLILHRVVCRKHIPSTEQNIWR